MSGEEITLELPHLRLRGLAWGPVGGAPLLALHGWLDNAATFAALAPSLVDARLVALDLPGHGRSDWRPPGAAYHFVDFTVDVVAAATALGWDRFHLLGHSMGAGIACLVAGTYPDRVQRLVLLEGLGPMSAPAAETPGRFRAALDREQALGEQPRRHPDLSSAVRARMRGSDLDPTAAERLVARAAASGEQGVRFRHDPRLKNPSRVRLTESQVLAFLAAIACPVLAVRAAEGWPFPASYLEPRLAAFQDLATVEIPGGHHVHLTHPDRVIPHLRDFLR